MHCTETAGKKNRAIIPALPTAFSLFAHVCALAGVQRVAHHRRHDARPQVSHEHHVGDHDEDGHHHQHRSRHEGAGLAEGRVRHLFVVAGGGGVVVVVGGGAVVVDGGRVVRGGCICCAGVAVDTFFVACSCRC